MNMSSLRFLAAVAALFTLTSFAAGAPSVTTLSPAAGSTVPALTSISVTFSEAVAGVDAGDLSIDGEGASSVSGTGAGPYVFTFTQPAAGTVSVSWDFDHGITGVGTGAFVPAGGWSYTLTDTVAPTVAKIRSSVAGQDLDAIVPLPGSTVGTLSKVQITFSEPVTGVDAADLLINGTAATAMTGSGAGPYVFEFLAPDPGTVNFSWAANHGIQDVSPAANAFVGNPWSVTLSSTGQGALVINEFLTANATSILDENQDQPGWIEIYNPGPNAVNLTGWALTNDEDDLGKWVFPNRTLAANAYLVVYASGKDRKPTSGNLHTNFKLNPTGEYLALVPPDYPRTPISQLNPYPVQRYDYSYGRQSDGTYRYIARPASTTDTRPGTANGTSSLAGITPKPSVSVSRGIFKEPFQVVISCADASAVLRYTLDGSAPLASSPVYSAPLNVTGTTLLRVTAFGASAIPSETITHSYVFPDQVFSQPSPPYDNPARTNDNTNPALPKVGNATFPISWGTSSTGGFPGLITNLDANSIPADYGMDPEIYNDPNKYDDNGVINNTTGKTNKERIQQGFRDLPSLSVVISMTDMFGSTGIYPNSTVKTPPVERACSIELLLPDGTKGFATTCGIRPHGNASRNPQNTPKHGFTLKFKGDFGADDLDYQLFPDSPVHKLDDVVLRADYNSSWLHGDGVTQRPKGTRQRDAWTKETFRAMGRAAGHHRYVNLFINGLFWGTYDASEQENDTFAANYFGGSRSDYEIVEQGGTKSATNVTGNVYSAMTSLAASGGLASNSSYEQMKRYLDIPEFADYMLLHFYVGHQDWGDDINKNWYAIRNRVKNGTFKYLPWDQENLLWDQNVDRTTVASPPSGLHTALVANAQYKLDFADRVHRHMVAPDGALLPQASIDRWNKWRALLLNSMVSESARWGDYRRDVHQYSAAPYDLYKWNTHLITEHNRLTKTYFPARTNVVLGQLRARGLYPTLNAPELRGIGSNGTEQALASRRVNAGYELKMALPTATAGTTSAGTIYLTTDGTDPRVYYSGSIATTAQPYTAPLILNANTTIKARTLNGTTWSALNEATFTVSAPLVPSVRITEIMYNPIGGSNYEFLELQNTGTQEVNMGGWYFEGVDFVFPISTVLSAGSRMVIASNNDKVAWASRYPGVTPLGYFGGSLDNAGERIALHDASGRIVVSVEYGNKAPWPQGANGGGYSLEIIDANGDPDLPSNWKISDALNGTAGLSNGLRPASSVELGEVMVLNNAVSNGGVFSPYIELRNNSASAVDVGNWRISGGGSYTIPTGTSIPANGQLVIWLDNAAEGSGLHTTALNLNPSSGVVELFNPGSAIAVDAIGYRWQVQGYSIGRVGAAGSEWVLTQASPGAANTAAALASSTDLVLNEWLANQGTTDLSDWVELYNKNSSLPAAIQGYYLQTNTGLARIPYLGFVAPGGFLQIPLGERFAEVDLKLPASGTSLALLDPSATLRDSVTVSPLAPGVSEGRFPDGTASIFSFGFNATPGAANVRVENYAGPVLNELLAINRSGEPAPWGTRTPWVELFNPGAVDFDLSGFGLYSSRVPNADLTFRFPAGTKIPAQGYLTVWLSAAAPEVSVPNGTLMAGGIVVSATKGALYLFDSSNRVVDAIEWGHQIADRSIGRSDSAWKLLATPTLNAANSAPATLGAVTNVRINEWLAAPLAPTGRDFVELYNSGTDPVEISGLYLTDDPSAAGLANTQIVPLSFIAPGGWAGFFATGTVEAFEATTNFSLDAQGEYLRLSASDLSLIDAVAFGAQTPGSSEGRFLDGQNITGGLIPTPGAHNALPPAPSITLQPLDQSAYAGGSVSFTVEATGSNPLTFQWLFNDTPIPGATSPTLTLNNVSAADQGRYACVATNTAGTVTSDVVHFTRLNHQPVAASKTLHAPVLGAQVQLFDASADATDADGDALAVTLKPYSGAGTVSTDGRVVSYTGGTFAGSQDVEFTVSDGFGDPVTVTITLTNAAPVANADTVTVPYNTATQITVLANDTDADGDVLVLKSVNGGTGNLVVNGNTVTYTPPTGFVGTDTFSYVINDDRGAASAETSVTVQVHPPQDPSTSVIVAKGSAVPGAGVEGSGIPAGATWASFGVPSINGAGETAFLAKVGTRQVVAGPKGEVPLGVIAGVGDAVAGADGQSLVGLAFSSFRDPLLNNMGHLAFLARVKAVARTGSRVTAKNDTGIWTNASGGQLRLVARTGDAAVGAGEGVRWKAFTSVALSEAFSNGAPENNPQALVAFVAQIEGGSPKITSRNDLGLWIYQAANGAGGSLQLVLREGQSLTLPGNVTRQVKTFVALAPQANAAGHGNGVVPEGVSARVTFVDGTQAILGFAVTGSFDVLASSGEAITSLEAPVKSFDNPMQNGLGQVAVSATLNTKVNNRVLLSLKPDSVPAVIARKGDSTESTGVTFSEFTAVVMNDKEQLAFAGTIAGPGVSNANKAGLWWGQPGAFTRVWQAGGIAPGISGNPTWSTKTPLFALPGGFGGPIFTATLRPSKPAKVTAANDTGVWAVSSTGEIRLLIREGDQIDGKILRSFTVLSTVSGSPSQRRSFNDNHALIGWAFFTDGSQSLVKVALP